MTHPDSSVRTGLALCWLSALLAGAPAAAHEGSHDEAAPPPLPAATSARFVASSDLFELVGELDGRRLQLYLDRAAHNEPVLQAELELELDGRSHRAVAQADGRFVVELPSAPAAGLHPVTATVRAGEDADLLAAELDLHGPAAAAPAARRVPAGSAAAGGVALLALAGLGWWRWRLRRLQRSTRGDPQ